MVIAMIVFGLLYGIAFFWNLSTDDSNSKASSVCLSTVSAIIFFALFSTYESRNTPTAKSVYEGKTTLEITYKDSIPVDTVVVFKDEFKK